MLFPILIDRKPLLSVLYHKAVAPDPPAILYHIAIPFCALVVHHAIAVLNLPSVNDQFPNAIDLSAFAPALCPIAIEVSHVATA